jgi:hypothetical protein
MSATSVYIPRDLFQALRDQLEQNVPQIKGKIFLWNNQFEHMNGVGEKGRNESATAYPVVYIELNEFEYKQLMMGVTEYKYKCILHIGYKALEKQDLKMYDFLETVYYWTEYFQAGGSGKLTKISERYDTNHDNAILTTAVYDGYNKNYNRYIFGQAPTPIPGYVTGATVTEIVVSAVTSYNNYSGATISGLNYYTPPTTPYNPHW